MTEIEIHPHEMANFAEVSNVVFEWIFNWLLGILISGTGPSLLQLSSSPRETFSAKP